MALAAGDAGHIHKGSHAPEETAWTASHGRGLAGSPKAAEVHPKGDRSTPDQRASQHSASKQQNKGPGRSGAHAAPAKGLPAPAPAIKFQPAAAAKALPPAPVLTATNNAASQRVATAAVAASDGRLLTQGRAEKASAPAQAPGPAPAPTPDPSEIQRDITPLLETYPFDNFFVTIDTADASLGAQVPENFLGTSHEYSEWLGEYAKSPEGLEAFASVFRELGPAPVMRLGGDSQEALEKPPSDATFAALQQLSKAANLRFIVGLPLKKNNIGLARRIMIKAKKYLGDSIIGFELGNEPDYWEVDGVRGVGGYGLNGTYQLGYDNYVSYFHRFANRLSGCKGRSAYQPPTQGPGKQWVGRPQRPSGAPQRPGDELDQSLIPSNAEDGAGADGGYAGDRFVPYERAAVGAPAAGAVAPAAPPAMKAVTPESTDDLYNDFQPRRLQQQVWSGFYPGQLQQLQQQQAEQQHLQQQSADQQQQQPPPADQQQQLPADQQQQQQQLAEQHQQPAEQQQQQSAEQQSTEQQPPPPADQQQQQQQQPARRRPQRSQLDKRGAAPQPASPGGAAAAGGYQPEPSSWLRRYYKYEVPEDEGQQGRTEGLVTTGSVGRRLLSSSSVEASADKRDAEDATASQDAASLAAMFIGPSWPSLAISPGAVRALGRAGTCYLKEVSVHYYTMLGGAVATMESLLDESKLSSAMTKFGYLKRAADDVGLGLRVSETNSAAGGGVRGLSNTFGAALWTADTTFGFAQKGASGVNMHWGDGGRPAHGGPDYVGVQTNYRMGNPNMPYPSVHSPWYGYLLFIEATKGANVRFATTRPIESTNTCGADVKIWALVGGPSATGTAPATRRHRGRTVRVAVINKDGQRGCNVKLRLGGVSWTEPAELHWLKNLGGLDSVYGVTWRNQTYVGTRDGRLVGQMEIQDLQPTGWAAANHGAAAGAVFDVHVPAGQAVLVVTTADSA